MVEEIIKEVSSSKKYSAIGSDIIRRICVEAAKKYPKKKDAIKAAKNELHIIHESFLTNNCHVMAKDILDAASVDTLLSDKQTSSEIMRLHASTNERLENMGQIYDFISTYIDDRSSVCDVGCGFNPFCMPFLQSVPNEYVAYDINNETIDLLNQYFAKLEKNEYRAEILDAVSTSPSDYFDVVLLFKLLPLLQQQKKGRAMEILSDMNFGVAIISFPLKSLSGKNKGMEEFYSNFFETNLPEEISMLDKQVIGNELFYAVKKQK